MNSPCIVDGEEHKPGSQIALPSNSCCMLPVWPRALESQPESQPFWLLFPHLWIRVIILTVGPQRWPQGPSPLVITPCVVPPTLTQSGPVGPREHSTSDGVSLPSSDHKILQLPPWPLGWLTLEKGTVRGGHSGSAGETDSCGRWPFWKWTLQSIEPSLDYSPGRHLMVTSWGTPSQNHPAGLLLNSWPIETMKYNKWLLLF